MLDSLRKAGRSWLGKIIVTLLFGLLIVSFAIWGINDIFRGGVSNTVATVGEVQISADQFRNAFQTELQNLSRRARRPITQEQARAFGIDQQVLQRLVTEAALDQRARDLGLSIPDTLVQRAILDDPTFRGSNGQFSLALYEDRLRSAGLSPPAYEREQRSIVARMQLAETLTSGLNVPLAMREAIHRYGAERRGAGYFVLAAAAAGEVPDPTPEQLQSFYESRKASFRAPEYRSFNVVALNADTLAKPDDVTEGEARQRYEQLKTTRFGTPERRTIQQIDFPTLAEAEAASQRIKGGATFEAIAAERGRTNLDLGTFTRAELFDKAVAEAAFSLAQGAVSDPIKGQFANVLVRVAAIQPESVKPFEEVAGEVRREIALERARNAVNDVHDKVEDLRAGARPLVEVAKELNLPVVTAEAVDRGGRPRGGGAPPALPEREAVLTAAFGSDIGVDTEGLRTANGGYAWYDVTRIDPARDRTLDEVRDQVAAQWREDEIGRRLNERGRALAERLDKGEPMETLAGEVGAPPKSAPELNRNVPKDELTADVVNRIFATPVGKAASAPAGDVSRVVFKVESATVPPFVTSTQDAATLEERLRVALTNDLLDVYLAQIQKDVGVSINQQVLRRTLGGEP